MKKVPNIPTWNYPSPGAPIYRNTSEIPPNIFESGGSMPSSQIKKGIYNYNGKKYKYENGKWYKNVDGTYASISSSEKSLINNLNASAVPVHIVQKDYSDNTELENLIFQELENSGITNSYLKQAMMGIIVSEGGLSGKPENMNYTKERLPEVWGAFSKTGKPVPKGQGAKYYNEKAEEYAGNPQKLAQFVYGDLKAKDLGNESPEDGWIYRGRGFNQLTGRAAYKKIGEQLGIDLVGNPELLDIDPVVQAKVVAQFMKNRLEELNSTKDSDLQKFKDYNSISNIEDAAYLLTRANAGFGKMPSQETIIKRREEARRYNQNSNATYGDLNYNNPEVGTLAPKPLEVVRATEESKLINPYFQQKLNQPSYQDERVFNVSENKIKGIEEILSPIQSTMKFKYGGVIFNDGGQMGFPVTEFGEGGTHEENPFGGIPQGIGTNGQPNLVEEGELKVKDPTTGEDFIITNNDKMVMTKEVAEKYNVPSRFIGKKLNKIGRDILRLDSKRIGDTIEETSKNRELTSFIEAHKELTAMQNAKDAAKREEDFIKEITELQEEYPEYMQALMAANQSQPQMQGPSPEEQMMMEQQMMQGAPQGIPGEVPQGMEMPMTYGETMFRSGGLNFKSSNAYNKWLAYGHASGEFAKTPGHQSVSIKGKPHSVSHDFGGIMRGIGSGLQAVSGVASMIPGVGNIVGAGLGAIGGGLQNVGTGAGFGEVMADAGIGALGAVPGIGNMIGQSIQGIVPNSPITAMNGGRLYDNGGETVPPTDEKKDKLLSIVSGTYPRTKGDKGVNFWELSPAQQQIVANRAGYNMGVDESGNTVFVPRSNYGVLSTHTQGIADLEKEGRVVKKPNPFYYTTPQPKDTTNPSEFITPEGEVAKDAEGKPKYKSLAEAQEALLAAKQSFTESLSKWNESAFDYLPVEQDKIVQGEAGIKVGTGWDPYYREETSVPIYGKTFPVFKTGEVTNPYYFNANRELFVPEQQAIVPQQKANGGGIGNPTNPPSRLNKLLEARAAHIEQMPFDIKGNRPAEYQRWEDTLKNIDENIIITSREEGVTLDRSFFLPKTTVSPNQSAEEAFKQRLMDKYGKVPKTFESDFRGAEFLNGGNKYTNGTPPGFGGLEFNYLNSAIDKFNQNNVIDEGPKAGVKKNLEYKQGLEGLLPLAPIAYNFYQGMQKPDEISADRYYNPVESPTLDYSEANKEFRRLFSGTQRALTETGSPGAYAANLGNVYSRMSEEYAKNIQEQENRQKLMDYQTAAQNASMKTASTQQADAMNMQAEQMRQAQLAQGFSQLGQFGRDVEANRMGLTYANMMAPDFQLKYSNIFDRMIGNKNNSNG